MKILHIANTDFEDELLNQKRSALNLIHLQLQFLPTLYADPEDGIGVTHLPIEATSSPFYLLSCDKCPYSQVESWGASREIAQWAKGHRLQYSMPPWEVVRTVNSKEFSFLQGPKLPGASLLRTQQEVAAWIATTPGPKVLKSCFGVSGRGHALLPCDPKRIERLGLPVIGEPWVSRQLDFSTQWLIGAEISYLGATICVCDARGKYVENRVGDVHIPHLEAHLEVAYPILQKMQAMGFFGNVGIDAFIYDDNKLHPIVEINARKTMGYVALRFQQHHFPKQTIALKYLAGSGRQNLLPSGIVKEDGTQIYFQRQLVVAY